MSDNYHQKFKINTFHVTLLATVSIVVLVILEFLLPEKLQSQTPPLNNDYVQAKIISETCRNSNQFEKCYEKEFINLSKKSSLASVKTILENLWKIDKRTRSCHSLAHKIASSNVTRKSYTLDQVLDNNEMRICSSGFFHGMIEGYFKTNPSFKLDSQFIRNICTQKSNQYTEGSCLHIFGHFLLVETNGNIGKATPVCAEIESASLNHCYAGIFMENFAKPNLSYHGIAQKEVWNSVFLKKSTQLCLKYKNVAAKGCWEVLGLISTLIYNEDSKTIFQFCKSSPTEQFSKDCYLSAVGRLAVTLQNQEDINVICSYIKADYGFLNTCTKRVVGILLAATPTFYDTARVYCQNQEIPMKNSCKEFLKKIIRKN